MSRALSLLTSRARTERELRERLSERFEPGDVERVVTRLKELHYLDDEAFAAAWIASRSGRRAAGPLRLRSELLAKGVPDEVVRAAIDALGDESQQAAANAAAAILVAKSRAGDPPDRVRQRVYGALIRRGFDHEQARAAIAEAMKQAPEGP